MPSMGPGNAAEQQQTVEEEKTTTRQSHSEEGFQMPALEEIRSESTVAKELDEEDIREAYELAKNIDLSNPSEALKFGLEEQELASKVSREFIEEVRNADLDLLSEIARDQTSRMEELNIGELEPSFFQRMIRKIMPKAQAGAIEAYLDKHKSLSELIDEGEQALADERVKLEELRERMAEKVDENTEIYEKLSKSITAAELSYAAATRQVNDYKKRNENSTSAAKLREINLMDQALTMQRRRLNSLKASRQETLNALNTMDLQVNRIQSQIEMINDQRTFNRMVWDNTVMMAATDKQMRNSVDAVQFNRKSIERMMKDRSGDIAETLKAIIQEEKAGVVNAAVLEYAAKQVISLNRTIIEGNKEIRDAMGEADEIIERMDEQVKHVLRNAAALSDEEMASLNAEIDQFNLEDAYTEEEEEDKKS